MKIHNSCDFCQNRHVFELDKDLFDAFLGGNVAIFAGAGISTESKMVLNYSFYDEISDELNNHSGLSFPELETRASEFHKALSTLFFQKTIVTTNWDTYFEDFCSAVPFVTDKDLAFWESSERKVLKIHGSINNFGSIVATTDDYTECERNFNSGIIGSILKTILATKTAVFIGYSLSDFDFVIIYNFVRKQMEEFHK